MGARKCLSNECWNITRGPPIRRSSSWSPWTERLSEGFGLVAGEARCVVACVAGGCSCRHGMGGFLLASTDGEHVPASYLLFVPSYNKGIDRGSTRTPRTLTHDPDTSRDATRATRPGGDLSSPWENV